MYEVVCSILNGGQIANLLKFNDDAALRGVRLKCDFFAPSFKRFFWEEKRLHLPEYHANFLFY